MVVVDLLCVCQAAQALGRFACCWLGQLIVLLLCLSRLFTVSLWLLLIELSCLLAGAPVLLFIRYKECRALYLIDKRTNKPAQKRNVTIRSLLFASKKP